MAKIVVGISGGVDSAVAALLLKKQGHTVIGVFMRNWDSFLNNDFLGNNNKETSCPQEQDWRDAQEIAKQIQIQIKRVDFVKEYWDYVFKDLIDKYQKGFTPNPDILCNKYIKFGFLYDWVFANIENVDYVAMGHYANVENGFLKKPLDDLKDQTYFLSELSHGQLLKASFPLGNMTKNEVRSMALKHNLIVANKKDSTGICFIGKRKFTDFLQNYIPNEPGKIIDIVTNEVVGDHIGVMYYTIGQRKGLKISGKPKPYFVVGHNLKQKIIYVATALFPEYLLSNKAKIIDINWNCPPHLENKINKNVFVKFRYRSKEVKCQIFWINKKDIIIEYPSYFKAVTPGQEAVFYIDDYCVGGGKISEIFLDNQIKDYLY